MLILYQIYMEFVLAVDEGDFGNSIELGIDLFCSGSKELHNVLLQLLVNGYSMVNKPQFIAIIKVSRKMKEIILIDAVFQHHFPPLNSRLIWRTERKVQTSIFYKTVSIKLIWCIQNETPSYA